MRPQLVSRVHRVSVTIQSVVQNPPGSFVPSNHKDAITSTCFHPPDFSVLGLITYENSWDQINSSFLDDFI